MAVRRLICISRSFQWDDFYNHFFGDVDHGVYKPFDGIRLYDGHMVSFPAEAPRYEESGGVDFVGFVVGEVVNMFPLGDSGVCVMPYDDDRLVGYAVYSLPLHIAHPSCIAICS